MANGISIKVTDNFEKEKYDSFVSSNPYTSIFQSLEMAEVYKKNIDTEPLILVAINENNGEILASLLAKKMQAKKGFLSSFSVHSTIRGGPIFKNTEDGVEAISFLLKEYNNLANKWGPLYTRIHPLFDTPQIISEYHKNEYEYSVWNNFLINLNRPVEDVWRDLDKYKRKNVNRAIKKGLCIEEINEKSIVPVFYEFLSQNYTERKQPLEDISNFEAIFDILIPKGMAKLFVAKFKDEYAAMRLVLLYKGVVYDWYTGDSKKFLSLYPNDLLVWHILKWGVENGFQTFDFGGGGTSDQIAEGWVEFKKRFGGRLINYGRYTKVHQQKKLWIAEKVFKVYKKVKFYKKNTRKVSEK